MTAACTTTACCAVNRKPRQRKVDDAALIASIASAERSVPAGISLRALAEKHGLSPSAMKKRVDRLARARRVQPLSHGLTLTATERTHLESPIAVYDDGSTLVR